MKALVNISEEQIKRIKRILSLKQYQSVSEFISLAIENQLLMEESSSTFDIPTIDSIFDLEKKDPISPERVENTIQTGTIIDNKILLANSMDINDDFPFWGTQNKYLCLKQIVLGFVELLSSNNEKWIRYDVAMNYLLNRAKNIRKQLENIDKKLYRPRGEKLSTGFPRNDSKSLTRYEKQFIGGIDSNNQSYGMSIDIGFLTVKKDPITDRLVFGLTKSGYDFSKLKSPIFNTDLSKLIPSTQPLSDEEREYLISILNKTKKSEIDLMRFSLKYIIDGKNHPDEGSDPTKEYLDFTYPEIAKNKREGSFSILESETIRSGIISRMNELGMIKIIRKGIKSEYFVTDFGNLMVKKWSGNL
jgi:hypothetical protein